MAKRRTSGRAGSKGTFIQASRAESPEQKALYHQVTGAGKSRVLRKFFELSEDDEQALTARVDAHLSRSLV